MRKKRTTPYTAGDVEEGWGKTQMICSDSEARCGWMRPGTLT